MVTGEPLGPEDDSSKQTWISGVWDWSKLSSNSKETSSHSPLIILFSRLVNQFSKTKRRSLTKSTRCLFGCKWVDNAYWTGEGVWGGVDSVWCDFFNSKMLSWAEQGILLAVGVYLDIRLKHVLDGEEEGVVLLLFVAHDCSTALPGGGKGFKALTAQSAIVRCCHFFGFLPLREVVFWCCLIYLTDFS